MSEQHEGSGSVGQKRLSRREVLKVGGVAAVGGLAAGALPKRSTFAAPAVLQGAKTKIKYLTWFQNEPGRAGAWKYIINKFNTSQNNVEVEETGWPFDQYTNKIVVQLQSGGIDGDVIQTTPDLALRLLKAEALAPVESVLTDLKITTLSKAHDYIRKDGHLYGLDVVTVAFGLLYESQLYQKAGITEPPKSVDEWVDVTKKLTKKPDQFGIYSPHLMSIADSFWFTLQEWAMPYDGIWAKGKTPMVTSPAVINGIKLFKTMYDAAMPRGTDDTTATKMYANGRIAQELIVSAAVNVFKTDGPAIYPSLRSTIPWASGKSIVRIHPITVNAQGKNQDASLEFIKFIYTPENYRELLTRCLDVVPSYDVGGLESYFKDLPWAAGYQTIKAPITPPEIMGDFIYNNSEFGQIVLNHYQGVLTGNQSVEDAMGAAQKELEDLAGRLS